MTRIIFEVPNEVIADFTEKLIELDLSNSIIGKDEDDIEIEILYDKDEAEQVRELETYLEELKDGLEEEGEEEDKD